METPRALSCFGQIPADLRLPLIEEGLELLVSRIVELRESAEILRVHGQISALQVLYQSASEEAAKVLILIDIVRHGWYKQKVAADLARAFYDHLSRGIYVHMVGLSPASFGEVRAIVERETASHYLAGPTGVEWEFRNQIESTREGSLYVDLVKYDDRFEWVSPESRQDPFHPAEPEIIKLVLALDQIGQLTLQGLELLLGQWADFDFGDETHWVENKQLTYKVISDAIDRHLPKATASKADGDFLLKRWPFPMGTLKLSRRNVDAVDLEKARQQARSPRACPA